VAKEGVVDPREVDDLEGEEFLAEVVRLTEGDVEPDAPEGDNFLPRHGPIEWCVVGAYAARKDAQHVEGAKVEDVEAAAPIHQDLREAHGALGSVDHERVAP